MSTTTEDKSPEEEMLYLMKRYIVLDKLPGRRDELVEDFMKKRARTVFDIVNVKKFEALLRSQDPEAKGSIQIYGGKNYKDGSIIAVMKKEPSGKVDVRFSFIVSLNYKYFGEMDDGYFHGVGILKMDETYYSGYFRNGKREGRGDYEESEWHYSGFLKADQRHGLGELTFKNGVSYAGCFLHDQMDGFGVYVAANADGGEDHFRYEGQFKSGFFHGHGRYETPAHKLTGMFYNSVMKEVVMMDKKSGKSYPMPIPHKIKDKDYRGPENPNLMVCPKQILDWQLEDIAVIYSEISKVGERLKTSLQSHRGGYKVW
jgi:hypothetical protein